MKKVFLVIGYWSLFHCLHAQSLKEKLRQAYQQFESDSQLRHAISSLYVINAKTGEVVFDKNSKLGLAPASTQKIITAATAFELLEKDYRYTTDFEYKKENDKSRIIIHASGDPTFGSWRWITTKNILEKAAEAIKNLHLKNVDSIFFIDEEKWSGEPIPDGWIWQDIGNYYGAGAHGFNWLENQYDVHLKSGKNIGGPVEILSSSGIFTLTTYGLLSELTSAEKGTGDQAYVYFQPTLPYGIIRGTIPINEDDFKISATIPEPDWEFINYLHNMNIWEQAYSGNPRRGVFFQAISPALDSIIYWFLQKSINLYGEALIKTFAYEKRGFGATDSGIVIVKDFWKQKGLDENELNIYDGSGLSPLNRVTTHAQVEILKYAKQRSWFPYFFNALPEYNNMKMKSGSISDVKGFCGYHTSGNGTQYIFSFLVNNYSGSSSGVVKKMYMVLDSLK